MLEMRLGLALGKSQGEVRKMPYPEFRRWRAFYHVEPFGWWNDEINTARLLSMIHNANVSKTSDAKSPKVFIREMKEAILEELLGVPMPDFSGMTFEEKQEYYRRAIMKDFGITK